MNPGWNQEGRSDYYDQPFFYIFDADDLTDGNSYQNLAVPLVSGSDFILRRIAGRSNVSETVRFRDRTGRNRQSALYPFPADYVVLPEILYPPEAQISFDLGVVTRASRVNVTPGSEQNYYAQLAFMGVRRFYGQQAPATSYRYYSRPYTITTQVNVDWTGRNPPAYTVLAGPRQFNVLVDSHDFELQAIHASIETEGNPVVACTEEIKLTLYDQNQQALSTAPVLMSYLADNNGTYSSVFPCPTLLYKANSLIRFDIMSLLIDAEVSGILTLDFIGAWRFPC